MQNEERRLQTSDSGNSRMYINKIQILFLDCTKTKIKSERADIKDVINTSQPYRLFLNMKQKLPL